jgi:preprotein translocase subunit SecA
VLVVKVIQAHLVFFLSLEDNLFTTFGGDQIKNIMKFLNFGENEPITEKSITNSLDKIQEKIEKYYYTVRKDVFKYDEVLNFYRNFVFMERNKILRSNNLRTEILLFNKALINNNLSDRAWYKDTIRQKILKAYKYRCQELFMVPFKLDSYYAEKNFNLRTFLYEQFLLIYDLKMIEIENKNYGLFNKIQKDLILEKIDFYWNDFLEKVNLLGEVIGWQNYAQKDPLIEYKKECSLLFDKFLSNVRRSVIYEILDIQII